MLHNLALRQTQVLPHVTQYPYQTSICLPYEKNLATLHSSDDKVKCSNCQHILAYLPAIYYMTEHAEITTSAIPP